MLISSEVRKTLGIVWHSCVSVLVLQLAEVGMCCKEALLSANMIWSERLNCLRTYAILKIGLQRSAQ